MSCRNTLVMEHMYTYFIDRKANLVTFAHAVLPDVTLDVTSPEAYNFHCGYICPNGVLL